MFTLKRSFAASLLFALSSTLPAPAGKAQAPSPLTQYGVCAEMADSDYQEECNRIVAAGIKWVRISPAWSWIEPARGTYNQPELDKLDYVVKTLTENGVQIDWILCYTAPWASSQPNSANAVFYKPANWADWTDFVKLIATRYNGKVTTWEIWNEEDGGFFWLDSAADYNTLLQQAAAALRGVNPGNRVVLGGLATSTQQGQDIYGPGTFLDTLLSLGAASSFDAAAYHPYGESARQYSVYNGMMAVLAKYGLQSRPLWATETGYTTVGDSAKEANKADYVDSVYALHSRWPNLAQTFFYTLRNTQSSPANPSEDNLGLTTAALAPLPAFFHLQALGAAATDFAMETAVPAVAAQARTLHYLAQTSGDGSAVTNCGAWGSQRQIAAGTYLYLSVNDGWLYAANAGIDTNVSIDVTYLDQGTGLWFVQYDGIGNAYTTLPAGARTNTGQWLTKTFAVSDAYFANRQNCSADLRLYAGTAPLTVSQVAIRKETKTARVALQNTDSFKLMTHALDAAPADEAYNPAATMGGTPCRQITDNSHYFYFQVSHGLVNPTDTNITIGITYWDAGTDTLLVQYNGTSSPYQSRAITKTNTNTWKYASLVITDAKFQHSLSYGADFRIGDGYDNSAEFVANVSVVANR